jgi:hypothetical protein
MTLSRLKPWWFNQTFEEFEPFGDVLSGQYFDGQMSIKIAIQPGNRCVAGDTRESVRRTAYELAEGAIAVAWERYNVRSIDFRIVDLGTLPFEVTLELGLDRKDGLRF